MNSGIPDPSKRQSLAFGLPEKYVPQEIESKYKHTMYDSVWVLRSICK